MDLAKNLAQWRDQTPEQWIALANRTLPPLVVAILILLIALKAADLTWRLLESPTVQSDIPAPVRVAANTGSAPVAGSYDSLTSWTPFGAAPEESSEPISADLILDAPDTSLNLLLVGTLQASELPERGSLVLPENGRATIASGRGEQKTYKTGDTIENASNARLHSVYTDRVILNRGGNRLETLRWEDNDTTLAQSNSRVQARPTVRRTQPAQPIATSASVAEAIGDTASLLSQHMQIVMAQENGQLIGFRLQPRGDGAVYSELGLEPGDILTEVNGIRLNNIGNTAQVLEALGEAQQASVTIRRNGNDMVEILDMSRLAEIAGSLQ